MLNSSSNFPSHTHTRWLSHLILGVLLVFPANPDGSVSTIAVYSSRLWPCLCRTGRGSPVPTHLSHQYIQTLAPLVSSPPPPAVGVGYVPPRPTSFGRGRRCCGRFGERAFFSLCGRVSRGLSSVLSKRERITAEISGSSEGERNMQQTDKHRSKTGKVVVLTLNCGSTASTICFFNACLGCYRCGLPQRQARFKANGSPRRSAKFLGSKLNKLLMGEAFLSHYRTLPPECP